MYVCICRAVTEADVRRAGHAGVTAPEDLVALFGLNDESCCGRCARRPEQFVALAAEGAAHGELEPAAALPSTPSLVAGATRVLLRVAVRPPPTAAGIRHKEA